MTPASGPKRFPALRARIGDWHYYVTTLPFHEVAERIQPATNLVTSRDMSNWIQREIVPNRALTIANYLIDRPQHFFSGIVVGVYLGEPTWYEINVENNVAFADPAIDRYAQYSLGLLELDGTEQLYAIDGQHRVAGIKAALERSAEQGDKERLERLANEDLSILFVSADIDREGQLERVRRLFTTLNKEAKKVSDAELVALDEDDAAAIVTRWIATRYDGLRAYPQEDFLEDLPNLIQLGTRDEIPPTNQRSVTTIVSLYNMTKGIFQRDIRALNRKYNGNRPEEEELEAIYREAVMIWDTMRDEDDALGNVLGSDPAEQRAARHRHDQGGHILFRPMGLQAFGRALGVLRAREVDTGRAVKTLCKLPMSLSTSPWVHVVWNPNTRNMINDQPIAQALFLHMVGHKPGSTRMKLRQRYRESLGLPEGADPLDDVPVYPIQ